MFLASASATYPDRRFVSARSGGRASCNICEDCRSVLSYPGGLACQARGPCSSYVMQHIRPERASSSCCRFPHLLFLQRNPVVADSFISALDHFVRDYHARGRIAAPPWRCCANFTDRSRHVGLLQSEYGDIYKVSLVHQEESVSEVKVKYFDTLPPCASICVLKTGFLFAASEFGNHALYQFSVGLSHNNHFASVHTKTWFGMRRGCSEVSVHTGSNCDLCVDAHVR